MPLVVSHAVLITCHRPRTHSCSPTSVYQIDTMKRKYEQAKDKVKDLLRPPSRQSALTKEEPENAITAGWSLWIRSCTIIAYTCQASKHGSHRTQESPIRLATSTPSSATGQSSTIPPWSITSSRLLMNRLVAGFKRADNILIHSTGEGPREDYSWYDAILS